MDNPLTPDETERVYRSLRLRGCIGVTTGEVELIKAGSRILAFTRSAHIAYGVVADVLGVKLDCVRAVASD